jgi:hypothetical protein
VFGEGIVEMGGPYSVKGLMANPICSPKYWKPSTFGGDVGFEIVNIFINNLLFLLSDFLHLLFLLSDFIHWLFIIKLVLHSNCFI